MPHTVKTITDNDTGLHVDLVIDEYPHSPRTDRDNLSVIVVDHRDWNLGDTHSYPLRDMIETAWGDPEPVGASIAEDYGARVRLPLEMAGDRYSPKLRVADDPHAEGVVGWIMDTYASRRLLGCEDHSDKKIREMLESELEEYNMYLRGEVFGIIVYDGDEPCDSLWEILGEDYALEEARRLLEEMGEAIRQEPTWLVTTETTVRATSQEDAIERATRWHHSGDRVTRSTATQLTGEPSR